MQNIAYIIVMTATVITSIPLCSMDLPTCPTTLEFASESTQPPSALLEAWHYTNKKKQQLTIEEPHQNTTYTIDITPSEHELWNDEFIVLTNSNAPSMHLPCIENFIKKNLHQDAPTDLPCIFLLNSSPCDTKDLSTYLNEAQRICAKHGITRISICIGVGIVNEDNDAELLTFLTTLQGPDHKITIYRLAQASVNYIATKIHRIWHHHGIPYHEAQASRLIEPFKMPHRWRLGIIFIGIIMASVPLFYVAVDMIKNNTMAKIEDLSHMQIRNQTVSCIDPWQDSTKAICQQIKDLQFKGTIIGKAFTLTPVGLIMGYLLGCGGIYLLEKIIHKHQQKELNKHYAIT